MEVKIAHFCQNSQKNVQKRSFDLFTNCQSLWNSAHICNNSINNFSQNFTIVPHVFFEILQFEDVNFLPLDGAVILHILL